MTYEPYKVLGHVLGRTHFKDVSYFDIDNTCAYLAMSAHRNVENVSSGHPVSRDLQDAVAQQERVACDHAQRRFI